MARPTPGHDGSLKKIPQVSKSSELYSGCRMYRKMPVVTNFVVFSNASNSGSPERLLAAIPRVFNAATPRISGASEAKSSSHEIH